MEIQLKQHIPSHLAIAGNNTIINYEGQPPTCFRCSESGHLQIECPRKNRQALLENSMRPMSWADMVANTSRPGKPEQATDRPQEDLVREAESTGEHGVEMTETEQGVIHKRRQVNLGIAEMSDNQVAIENDVPNPSNTDTTKKERMTNTRK